jgi:hypothetical protein
VTTAGCAGGAGAAAATTGGTWGEAAGGEAGLAAGNGLPQPVQNFKLSAIWAPQFVQNIDKPPKSATKANGERQ